MLAGHKYAALLSFEGPDRYSSVGGLGTRATALAKALGEAEIETELSFVGDPRLPAVETFAPNVTLRRWCQWISAYHPRDVYDGEAGKVADFRESVPRFVADGIVAKAHAEGERVLIVAEEWQTAGAATLLDVTAAGWQPHVSGGGGREPYGETVFEHARLRGLRVERLEIDGDDLGA